MATSKIIYPDKNTGDTFSGSEATSIKNIVNQHADAIDALIAATYVQPIFTSQPIFTGQSTTVENGTTLSGSKTVTWAIDQKSGIVNNVDIYDNTAAATLLAATPNDGTQIITITTIQLNTPGSTQSWKIIANNSSPTGTINSNNFIVTSRYSLFFGTLTASPTNSATVRAMLQNSFYISSGTQVILNSGTTNIKFGIATPPGTSSVSAIDLDASNASVTYSFVGNINVLDGGGTTRSYSYFEANISLAYSSNHRHQITIS